jgi:hypothetical protein
MKLAEKFPEIEAFFNNESFTDEEFNLIYKKIERNYIVLPIH